MTKEEHIQQIIDTVAANLMAVHSKINDLYGPGHSIKVQQGPRYGQFCVSIVHNQIFVGKNVDEMGVTIPPLGLVERFLFDDDDLPANPEA